MTVLVETTRKTPFPFHWRTREISCHDVDEQLAELSSGKNQEVRLKWREIGSSTVCASMAEVAFLERLYILNGKTEIWKYLHDHPFLSPILLDAWSWISKYFAAPLLTLEIVSEPEADYDSQLVLSILTDLKPDVALLALDEFDNDWWLDAITQVQGKLCINLEFE